MTDTIEQKALALVNAEQAKSGCLPIGAYHGPCMKALCRVIEQHEAYRQEVSDAVEHYRSRWPANARRDIFDAQFSSFIIAKPDPLVEALDEIGVWGPDRIDQLRAAIEKRGGKIVWGEG